MAKTIITEGTDEHPSRTLAAWSENAPSLLPQTDAVGFVTDAERGGGLLGLVPWEQVQGVVGHRMEPTDYWPPRVRVDSFPTESELLQMGLTPKARD